jgi:nucleoside-diphosphate-sugar epimerase
MASCIDSELKAVDAYSRSKIDTFTTLSEIFNDSQTRFIWPRIFQTFGRGQDPKRFIPYLISSFKNNISPEIINPSHVYDWIHVSDVAKAIIFSIKNQVEGAVDVGTSIGTSNKELANSIFNEVASATNSPIFSSINKAQGLVMSNKSVLLDYGWKPEVDLNCGIRELIVSKL